MVHQSKRESYLMDMNDQFTPFTPVLGLRLIALSNRHTNPHILPWSVSIESPFFPNKFRIMSVALTSIQGAVRSVFGPNTSVDGCSKPSHFFHPLG